MVGLPSVYGPVVKILSEGEEFSRCPTCGEAIRCDEPIFCLDAFHDREPEIRLDDQSAYVVSLLKAQEHLRRILGGF